MKLGVFVLLIIFSGCVCESEPEVHTVTSTADDFFDEDQAVNTEPTIRESTSTIKATTTTLKIDLVEDSRLITKTTVIEHALSATTSSVAGDLSSTTQAHLSTTTKSGSYSFACVDSDDGINTDFKGYVEYQGILYADRCEEDQVVEYYCDEERMKLLKVTCLSGCSDSICRP